MQGTADDRREALRIGIGRAIRHRREAIVVERDAPALESNAIDPSLRKDGTQPGRETAATVKIPEQRFTAFARTAHAVELGVQRIGDLTRGAGCVEGVCGAIEDGTVHRDKMLPRSLIADAACAREREIFEVKAAEVSLDLAGGCGAHDSPFERLIEHRQRDGPALGVRAAVTPLQQLRLNHPPIESGKLPCPTFRLSPLIW